MENIKWLIKNKSLKQLKMSVLELNDLVKAIEEEFGVTAAPAAVQLVARCSS